LGAPSSVILPFACEIELILIEELDVEFEHKVEHEEIGVILWLVVTSSDFCDDFDGWSSWACGIHIFSTTEG